MKALPYKISTLVYLRDPEDRVLLMRRAKAPNQGLWSPIGGKLEMATGESPYQAAVREVMEETGLAVVPADLHLFALMAEEAYEGTGHWLMFLFTCRKRLPGLPPPISEGCFAFFREAEVENLPIPETDRQALWPAYRDRRDQFTAFRARCQSAGSFEIFEEEAMLLIGHQASLGTSA